jgi:peptide/nickel transport system substrate-binding protein
MPERRSGSIIALVIGLASCSGPVRAPDVIVYASGTDLESANPLVTIHPLSRQVQRHVLFVTLARYDSLLVPGPYFARQWTWDRARRLLTLRLDPTLHWHDGTPTTARDVVFTLETARNPRTGFARAADLGAITAVTAPDDSTVMIAFAVAQREFPRILAELPIVPMHLLRDVPADQLRRVAFNTTPVGNGPFRFVDRVAGQRWTFARNEAFPAALGGAPHVRRLVVAVVDEATTKFAGLAAGDLDFAGIAPTMAQLAKRDPMIDVVDYPVLFSTAVIFNTHRPPLDDARVRQAIDLAIDRERIVQAALAGYGTIASGPVPPENPLAARRLAGKAARRADSLLDASGWLRGRDGYRGRANADVMSLELLTVGSGDNAVEQLLQADFAERGIRLEIRQLELAAFLSRARASPKTFDLLITGIPGDLSLAYLRAMFESSQRGSSLDYASFHTPVLDRLFRAATDARSENEARVAWLAVQDELSRSLPASWIYHSRGLQGVSSRMRNVVMDLRGELVSVTRWTTSDSPRASPGVATR